MELLINQRVFSWTDSYDVYDETGAARYFVKAEFFQPRTSDPHLRQANRRETGQCPTETAYTASDLRTDHGRQIRRPDPEEIHHLQPEL